MSQKTTFSTKTNDPQTEYLRCATDPWYFITQYGWVQDRQKGDIPFEAWPHLELLVTLIQQEDRLCILKARQLGVTWVFVGLTLWYGLFQPNANVVVFSKTGREAIKFGTRVKFMYSKLPEFLQLPMGKANEDLITFPTMGSELNFLPPAPGTGRSESASLVILDEWAFQEYAEENLTAILPIVEYGKLVGISTANGMVNTFAETYFKAKKAENSFLPVFFPWTFRPGRTQEDIDKVASDLPGFMVHQEYPLYEHEAFVASGTCLFDVPTLRNMPVTTGTPHGLAEIWHPPADGRRYGAGIDTAYAGKSGDYSVCTIVDEFGNQVAKLRTQSPLESFAEEAFKLLQAYGFPRLAIEVQGQGLLVHKVMVDKQFGNGKQKAQYPKSRIFHRSKNNPGWHTGNRNRDVMLGDLEIGVRQGDIAINSSETVEEFLSFGRNPKNDKFEALTGHDDEVMSFALAWQMILAGGASMSSHEMRNRPYIHYVDRKRGRKDDVAWEDPQTRTVSEYLKHLEDEREDSIAERA